MVLFKSDFFLVAMPLSAYIWFMAKNRFVALPSIPWFELRFTDKSTESYKDHYHSELSIGAVTQGATTMHLQGENYLVTTGSLVVIGPDTVHSCNPKEGSRSYLMAYFDAGWCLALQRDILGEYDELQLPEMPVVNNPALFSRLLSLANNLNQPGFVLSFSEQLTGFVADLLQLNDQCFKKNTPISPAYIDEIKVLLTHSLDENITLQQLAAKVGYNPYHLLRSFKKNVGLTPHEYRLNVRIDRAKKLLKRGLSPAAVAAETGFVDQSHFHRTFRQFAAATPGQYQSRS